MPATARQTRKQIRQSIGLQLGAVNLDAGSITHSPSETAPSAAKLIDQTLYFGGEDEHRGKWLLATDSNSSVYIRRVSQSSPDERSLTVSVPFDRAPDTGWTYELWDEDVSPVLVHQFINDALVEVTRKGSIETVDTVNHTGGDVSLFRTDSSWTGIKDIQWRSAYVGEQFSPMDVALSTLTSNIISEVDSADYREGSGAVKLGISSAESSATSIASLTVNAVDARGYDRVEFWYKTGMAITSSALVFQLMQTSSAHHSFSLSSTGGSSWIYVTATLNRNDVSSALDGIRIRTGSSDAPSSMTVWFDDVKLVRRDTDVWRTLPHDFWTIDQINRRVIIKEEARIPYAKLLFTGVRSPNQLTADTAISEIDPQYVVHSAMAKILRTTADRRGSDVDGAFKQAQMHEQLAQAMRLRWSMPSGIRWLDD